MFTLFLSKKYKQITQHYNYFSSIDFTAINFNFRVILVIVSKSTFYQINSVISKRYPSMVYNIIIQFCPYIIFKVLIFWLQNFWI